MPRCPRAHVSGGIFHVTSRGNRSLDIFRLDEDHERFLGQLTKTVAKFGWRCHAFCLMSNHYHLLVDMPKPTLSAGMHWLNTCYALWFNRRHAVSGHLFQDRFYSAEIDSEAHLLEVARYIPLNPVRAGLCAHPAAWPWSSYRATLVGFALPFLDAEWLLGYFGRDRKQARVRYERFVADGMASAAEDMSRGLSPGRDNSGHADRG